MSDCEAAGPGRGEAGPGNGEAASFLDVDPDEEPYPLACFSQQAQQSAQKSPISEDQDEQIAAFIESHPAFYDMTDPDYKNKLKKSAWLRDVAAVIGLTPAQIYTRFQTMRTDYHKLKRKVAGKSSGKRHTKLTALQHFKLYRYKFLDAHYRGKVSSSAVGSPNLSPDRDVVQHTGPSVATSSKRKCKSTMPKSKKAVAKKEVPEVLAEYLTDSQKELWQSPTLAETANSDQDYEPYPFSQAQLTSQKSPITEEQDDQIAAFIESHPAFYDMSNLDYKNKVKKNAWMKELALAVGLTPKQVFTRFQTMRTDYFKLKRKLDLGQIRVTPLQQFKLGRYKFLEAHYRGRGAAARAIRSLKSSSDEDEYLGVSAGTSSEFKCRGSGELPVPKAKRKEAKKGLAEVLEELRQSKATVVEATSSAGTSAASERVAWAQWLASMQQEIPQEMWRAYQEETFSVAMRYVRGAQQQPHFPQPQALPQQSQSQIKEESSEEWAEQVGEY